MLLHSGNGSQFSKKDINGINIISLGAHGRRTWMTYNKILDEKYRIGIISITEDNDAYLTGRKKAFKTLRETLGIIYYWFILAPLLNRVAPYEPDLQSAKIIFQLL